jgi:hypothetical protein
MPKSSITFGKHKIPSAYGTPIFDVYYVIENNRSQVMEGFWDLNDTEKDGIKALICKMATVKNFKSDNIKYRLRDHSYGELRPFPHRFFFFQKCGENYIFFQYRYKKEDSLGNPTYKILEGLKEKYEKEFEKYIEGNQ